MAQYFESTNGDQLIRKSDLIKEHIQPYLKSAKEWIIQNSTFKKPSEGKIQYRIKMRIKTFLQRYRPIANIDALAITDNEIYDIYCDYSELIAYLNEELGAYTPSKAEFCAFAEISIEAYQKLLEDGEPSVKEVLKNIELELISDTMASAENGITKETSTNVRLTARGKVGHNVATTSPFDKVASAMSASATFAEHQRLLELAEMNFLPKQKRKE